VAYQASGAASAFLTFGLPGLSEAYWFITIWHETGSFLNLYTLRLLAWGFVILVGATMLMIGTKLQKSSQREQSLKSAV